MMGEGGAAAARRCSARRRSALVLCVCVCVCVRVCVCARERERKEKVRYEKSINKSMAEEAWRSYLRPGTTAKTTNEHSTIIKSRQSQAERVHVAVTTTAMASHASGPSMLRLPSDALETTGAVTSACASASATTATRCAFASSACGRRLLLARGRTM